MGQSSGPRRRSNKVARQQADTVLAMLDNIAEKALGVVDGCFKAPDEPGYNPDATVPWTEASTRTRLGAQVYQQVMQNSREVVRGAVALGVVAMHRQMSREEWERKAKKVDDDAKKEAIDAVATVVNEVMDTSLVATGSRKT